MPKEVATAKSGGTKKKEKKDLSSLFQPFVDSLSNKAHGWIEHRIPLVQKIISENTIGKDDAVLFFNSVPTSQMSENKRAKLVEKLRFKTNKKKLKKKEVATTGDVKVGGNQAESDDGAGEEGEENTALAAAKRQKRGREQEEEEEQGEVVGGNDQLQEKPHAKVTVPPALSPRQIALETTGKKAHNTDVMVDDSGDDNGEDSSDVVSELELPLSALHTPATGLLSSSNVILGGQLMGQDGGDVEEEGASSGFKFPNLPPTEEQQQQQVAQQNEEGDEVPPRTSAEEKGKNDSGRSAKDERKKAKELRREEKEKKKQDKEEKRREKEEKKKRKKEEKQQQQKEGNGAAPFGAERSGRIINEHDESSISRTWNILVLGSQGCGKSSFIQRCAPKGVTPKKVGSKRFQSHHIAYEVWDWVIPTRILPEGEHQEEQQLNQLDSTPGAENEIQKHRLRFFDIATIKHQGYRVSGPADYSAAAVERSLSYFAGDVARKQQKAQPDHKKRSGDDKKDSPPILTSFDSVLLLADGHQSPGQKDSLNFMLEILKSLKTNSFATLAKGLITITNPDIPVMVGVTKADTFSQATAAASVARSLSGGGGGGDEGDEEEEEEQQLQVKIPELCHQYIHHIFDQYRDHLPQVGPVLLSMIETSEWYASALSLVDELLKRLTKEPFLEMIELVDPAAGEEGTRNGNNGLLAAAPSSAVGGLSQLEEQERLLHPGAISLRSQGVNIISSVALQQQSLPISLTGNSQSSRNFLLSNIRRKSQLVMDVPPRNVFPGQPTLKHSNTAASAGYGNPRGAKLPPVPPELQGAIRINGRIFSLEELPGAFDLKSEYFGKEEESATIRKAYRLAVDELFGGFVFLECVETQRVIFPSREHGHLTLVVEGLSYITLMFQKHDPVVAGQICNWVPPAAPTTRNNGVAEAPSRVIPGVAVVRDNYNKRMTGYTVFLQERPGKKISEVALEWQGLPRSEKQAYEEIAAQIVNQQQPR